MRTILFILAIAILPIVSHAQRAAKYIAVQEKFVAYYNAVESDSLYSLFAPQHRGYGSWSENGIKKYHEQYGKIVSFKFMFISHHGPDTKGRPMAYFKTTFDKEVDGKSVHALAFSLNKDGKIFGQRFITTDDYIDKEILKY